MSTRKTSVFVRDLEPGIPQTIECGCEFVFVERARELTVIAESNRMTGRRSGDNIRFDESVKKVTIESSVKQRVELVLGFGDFNRLIIEGRLVLDERIETNALNTDLLPVEFTKTVGLVSTEELAFSAGQSLDTSFANNDTFGWSNSFFEFDHKIYLILKTEIRVFDFELNLLDTVPLLSQLSGLLGADVGNDGFAYAVRWGGIYKVNLYSGEVTLHYNYENLGAELTANFAFCRNVDGRLWLSKGQSGVFKVFNFDKHGFDSDVVFEGVTRWGAELFDKERGYLLFCNIGGGSYQVYDSKSLRYVGDEGLPASQMGGFISRKKNRMVVSHNDFLNLHVLNDVVYTAQLYIQDGQNAATKREYYITGNYTFLSRGAGVVIRGEIIAAILQGLDVGGGLSSNYLDYVVSLKYTDGNYALLRDAGSSSFAYRGFNDVGELFLESEVTIKLLPQYLTAQI